MTTPSFTCPKCERTSYHPMDVFEQYCGACHEWTSTTKEHDRAMADYLTWVADALGRAIFSHPYPLSRAGGVVSRKYHARKTKR